MVITSPIWALIGLCHVRCCSALCRVNCCFFFFVNTLKFLLDILVSSITEYCYEMWYFDELAGWIKIQMISKITKSYCTFTFQVLSDLAVGINNVSNKCENGPWPMKMNKQSTKVKQSFKITQEPQLFSREILFCITAGMWNTEFSIT